jgi:hypothetical protein
MDCEVEDLVERVGDVNEVGEVDKVGSLMA